MQKNHPVRAFLLDKKGSALELTYEELDGIDRIDKILWVHFDYSSKEAIEWIRNKSNIDSVAIDALLTEETRPRTTVLGEALLIALRGVNLNPNSKPEDMISIRLYISLIVLVLKHLEIVCSINNLYLVFTVLTFLENSFSYDNCFFIF